ncbi:MAG TPA: acyl-CoA dehydrogenase family protein, partial [Candidatus Binatia bacterium]|nr:acyl-CoA dehydrogenase family protein [Candidatus Binatia bacterium]
MLPFLDEDHFSLRARVRQWVEKHLFIGGGENQELDEQARRLVQLLGNQGFLAYTVPKEFGGVREKVQARDLCIVREELARGSALADAMFAMQALGSYPITLFG